MAFGPMTFPLLGLGLAAYSMTRKPPPVPKPGPPPTMQEGEPTTKHKPRKYRPAAQVFSDEDMRLGPVGQLGRMG